MVNYKPSPFHGHKENEPLIFWCHDFDL